MYLKVVSQEDDDIFFGPGREAAGDANCKTSSQGRNLEYAHVPEVRELHLWSIYAP